MFDMPPVIALELGESKLWATERYQKRNKVNSRMNYESHVFSPSMDSRTSRIRLETLDTECIENYKIMRFSFIQKHSIHGP